MNNIQNNLKNFFVECNTEDWGCDSQPMLLNPDTHELYATSEEVGAMTADEVLGILNQFIEDYNLGTLYKKVTETTTEYIFEGVILCEDFEKYKAIFLNANKLLNDGDKEFEESFNFIELFKGNYIEVWVNITDYHREIDFFLPGFTPSRDGVFLCYYDNGQEP